MKFLLAIAMSTVLTGTAFGACSVSSVKDCSTKKECEDLSKEGQKFTFNEKATVKCMLQETSVATNCLENNNSSTPKVIDGAGKDGVKGAGAVTK